MIVNLAGKYGTHKIEPPERSAVPACRHGHHFGYGCPSRIDRKTDGLEAWEHWAHHSLMPSQAPSMFDWTCLVDC